MVVYEVESIFDDQIWSHVIIDRMGSMLFKWFIIPSHIVSGNINAVNCKTVAYHVIYTRDYIEKNSLMIKD